MKASRFEACLEKYVEINGPGSQDIIQLRSLIPRGRLLFARKRGQLKMRTEVYWLLKVAGKLNQRDSHIPSDAARRPHLVVAGVALQELFSRRLKGAILLKYVNKRKQEIPVQQ